MIHSYNFLRFLICFAPIFFNLVVYYTGNVDYHGLFETAKYTSIAKNWLSEFPENIPPNRLPAYPLFIAIIFKIFGIDNLNALLLAQSILGCITIFLLIKILEDLKIGKNFIVLLTVAFNFGIIFRFSTFLPNCFFIFFLTLGVFGFTRFYLEQRSKYFFIFCSAFFILILTRPIFYLSILITVPLIILHILKIKKKRFTKICLILCLLTSYVSAMGVQILRSYNYDRSLVYTVQAGEHFFWVIACLSNKYACGTRDMKVYNYLRSKYEEETQKIENLKLEDISKIKFEIGKRYIYEKTDKSDLFFATFFSYIKLFFHSSLIEIFGAFNLNSDEIYSPVTNNIFEKISSILKNALSNPINFIWIMSMILIVFLRLLQFYGFTYCFVNHGLKLYLLIVSSMILVLSINGIGIGNPRYRSEIEPLLVILGAVGIDNIKKIIRKQLLKNQQSY